jgi:hypothetical protein
VARDTVRPFRIAHFMFRAMPESRTLTRLPPSPCQNDKVEVSRYDIEEQSK